MISVAFGSKNGSVSNLFYFRIFTDAIHGDFRAFYLGDAFSQPPKLIFSAPKWSKDVVKFNVARVFSPAPHTR